MSIRLTSIFATALLAVTACTPSVPPPTSVSADGCVLAAEGLVEEAREYVTLFDDVSVGDLAGSDIGGVSELDQIVTLTRTQAIGDGCDIEIFDVVLGAGIDALTGSGPVGRRVAMSLQGVEPEAQPPRQVSIGPDEDLVGVILELGSGSQLSLGAGEYLIDELILLDRSITLIGAGRDDTFIRSSASGAAMLIVGQGEYALSSMSIEHVGDAVASVVVANSGSLTVSDVLIAGAIGDPEAAVDGHGLAVVYPTAGDVSQTRTVLVRDVVVMSNTGIGIAVLGAGNPHIEGSRIADNGFCGVCFINGGGDEGSVKDSVITGNQLGIGAGGESTVLIEGSEIVDNLVAGILAEDAANVTVSENMIADNGETGIEVLDDASATTIGNEIRGHRRGMAVGDRAEVRIESTAFDTNEAGMILGGDATVTVSTSSFIGESNVGIAAIDNTTGTVVGTEIQDALVGVQLSDGSALRIEGNFFNGSETIGALVTGASTSTIIENTFVGFGIGIQVGGEATPEIIGNIMEGEVGTAILSVEASAAAIQNNVIDGYDIGYQVSGAATPTISGGSVASVAGAAALYLESGGGTLSGIEITDADVGVMVAGEAAPAIDEISIAGEATAGVVYRESGSGTAIGLTVDVHAEIGIQVVGSASPSITESSVGSSVGTGILIAGTSTPSISSSRVSGSLAFQVAERARPSIVGNTVRPTGAIGVEFNGEARGRFDSNDVRGADEIGIKISGYAAPTLRSNTISRNGPVAVASVELSSPTVVGNRIKDAEVGIQVIDGASPDVLRNTFTDIASVSALFLGSVGGSAEGNVCPDGIGIIAFGGTTTEIGENDCEISAGF